MPGTSSLWWSWGGYLALARHRLRLNRWIFLGAISVCGTNVLFSMANKLTTAANTIVLQFTAPIFVVLLSALFWKRRPQRLDLGACALVMLGVLCFFVDSLEMGGMLGNALALLSGLSYAGVFLLEDLPDADPISSVFWGDALSVVIGFPFLLQETEFTAAAVTSVVILGAFQVGLAYVLMCIRPAHDPGGDRVSHLRHRARAQPHPGGGLLRRGDRAAGSGRRGHCGGVRGGV